MAGNMHASPVAGALGAEIIGVDLNQVSEQVIKDIRSALLQHGVIFSAIKI